MARTGRHKQTGEPLVFDDTENGWVTVSEEEYEAAKKGTLQSLGPAIMDNIEDTVGMAVETLPQVANQMPWNRLIPGMDDIVQGATETGQSIQAQNNQAQEYRWKHQPGAEIGALVGAVVAPAGGVGAATKIIGRGGRAGVAGGRAAEAASPGVEAGVRAGNSAVRAVTSRASAAGEGVLNVAENIPLVGGAVRNTRQGLADTAATLRRNRALRSINAAANQQQRLRPGLMTEDEAAEFADGYFPNLHPAQQAKLNATNQADETAAKAILREVELRERVDPSVTERLIMGEGDSLTATNMDLREAVNRTFMREIGSEQQFPDVNNIGARIDEIGSELNQLRGTDPIDTLDLTEAIKRELVEEGIISGEGERAVKKATQWIDDFSEDGMMSPENWSIVDHRLQREIMKQSGKPDTEVSEILRDIKDRLRERVAENLTPEQMARDKELRRQYGHGMTALERRSALGEDGLNIKSWLNRKGQKDSRVKKGQETDPLVSFLRTIEAIGGDKLPTTGSGEAVSRIARD